MTSVDPRPQSGAWTRAEPPPAAPPAGRPSAVTHFLGGSPLAVAFRLFVLSFLVGVLLMWLDIRPEDVVFGVERFFQRIWSLGFDAVRQAADYIVAGALIVVPIWFIARLLNMRSLR
jgi:hypothetical protein